MFGVAWSFANRRAHIQPPLFDSESLLPGTDLPPHHPQPERATLIHTDDLSDALRARRTHIYVYRILDPPAAGTVDVGQDDVVLTCQAESIALLSYVVGCEKPTNPPADAMKRNHTSGVDGGTLQGPAGFVSPFALAVVAYTLTRSCSSQYFF